MTTKTQTLRESQIRTLVEAAKEDLDACLVSPMWGYIEPQALKRQHRRFIAVMGVLAASASFAKTTGLTVGVFLFIEIVLYFEQSIRWYGDLVFALAFGVILGVIVRVHTQYREAFTRTEVNEHWDYTDPDAVTGIHKSWNARLWFYGRPDCWRGDNEHNGIGNQNSKVFLSTGLPQVEWLEDGEVQVTRTKRVTDFRTPADLIGLPAERFSFTGSSARARRAQLRRFERHGLSLENFERDPKTFFERNIAWFAAGALALMTMLMLMFR